jgi:thiamine-phosphate pyrophosphorylase
VGMSVHSVAEAKAIDARLVDYAIAGPAFETRSKPGYGPASGPDGIAEIARACSVPVLAIGGIDVTRASELLAGGVSGLAVIGAVMRALDPSAEVKGLLSAFRKF